MTTANYGFVCRFVASAVIACVAKPLVAQRDVAPSPDGRWVAYVAGDTLRVVATGPRATTKSATVSVEENADWTPRWDPTGERLAYYSSVSGSSQLWVYDVQARTKRQISSVDGGIAPNIYGRFSGYAPLPYTWSPDGKTIAFGHDVVVADSVAKSSLASLPESQALRPAASESLALGRPLILTGTTPRQLTLQGVIAWHSGSVYKSGKWSYVDDRDQMRRRTSTQLFLLDVATGHARQITTDTADYFTPDWSPDGKQLTFMSLEGRPLTGWGPPETNIYSLDLNTGRRTQLTRGLLQKTQPRWSPDGHWIAYLGAPQMGRLGVYVVASNGRKLPRLVTAKLDRSVLYWFEWASDGRAVIVPYRDGLAEPLARIDIVTGDITPVSPPDAYVDGFGTSAAGTAWKQSVDPSAGTQLWFASNGGRAARPLVTVVPAADPRMTRRQEAVHWRNGRGVVIDGIVVYPRNYVPGRAYPVIVDTYGNSVNARLDIPNDRVSPVPMSPEYVVFNPNHRAPHMWANPVKSAAYDSAATGPDGIAVMADDIMSGIDTLARRGVIDTTRMCLFGLSNGGLEGEQVLTQTSRFKCAVLQSPSTSDWLLQFFLSTDDPEVIQWMNGVTPWQDPGRYTSLVPLFHADKIHTPVLLAVGDKENLVLLATIEMYNALRFLKREVTLLRYPDQGHVFDGAAEVDFQHRVQSFFQAYLGPVEH